MKRQSSFQEPGHDAVKVRRQDPVSCERCRTKKLKCDRESPCSNCRARKLACSSASGIKDLRISEGISAGLSASYFEDINLRLRRLENLLAKKTFPDSGVPRETKRVLEQCDNIENESPHDMELETTATWLEIESLKKEPDSPSYNPSGQSASVADVLEEFIFTATKPPPSLEFNRRIKAILPPRSVGSTLLKSHLDHISWVYHIVHIPTVVRHFDNVYDCLESHQKPCYSHVALIATIFGIVAYITPNRPSSIHLESQEPTACALSWISLAKEALTAAKYRSLPTIETIQSLLLICQHLLVNLGDLTTFKVLLGMVLHMARSLSLHQVDSPRNKRLRHGKEVDWAELEVKRRIWWHLASTDWLMQFASGPHCGTYTIHPKQMNVDLPTNVDDEMIGSNGGYAQPLDVPTGMSFFLARITLAKTFCEMIDTTWNSECDTDNMPYDLIVEFDQKMHNSLSDFNKRFGAYMAHNFNGNESRKIQLLTQQNMGAIGIYARISRLHRPYLIRGARDPRYAYSRMVCLRSARTVIELGVTMMKTQEQIAPWCTTHHIFVSTILLIMDYCFNRDEPRARERKDEILECLNLLESRLEENNIANRGLQSLRNLLRDASSRPKTRSEMAYPRALELIKVAAESHGCSISSEDSPFTVKELTTATQNSESWPELEFPSFQNVDFDVDLDASEFESLFYKWDPNNDIF